MSTLTSRDMFAHPSMNTGGQSMFAHSNSGAQSLFAPRRARMTSEGERSKFAPHSLLDSNEHSLFAPRSSVSRRDLGLFAPTPLIMDTRPDFGLFEGPPAVDPWARAVFVPSLLDNFSEGTTNFEPQPLLGSNFSVCPGKHFSRKDSADSGISNMSRKTSTTSNTSCSSILEEPVEETIKEEVEFVEPDLELCKQITEKVSFVMNTEYWRYTYYIVVFISLIFCARNRVFNWFLYLFVFIR